MTYDGIETCLLVYLFLRLPITERLSVPTQVEHVNGNLHRVSPTTCFSDLPPGSTLQVDFEAELFIVSRTDVLPNWYVVEAGCALALIVSSTAGYNRAFVRPFTKPVQWKTGATDTYNPLSPEDRYTCISVGASAVKEPGHFEVG